MANCINCEQQISVEEKTCPYCGVAQQSMMTWKAGASLYMQRQGARRSVGKRVGIIAGIIVAFAFVIVLVIKLTEPGALTPKAAIRSYVEAVLDEDIDDYLDACYPKKLLKDIKALNDDFEDEVEYALRYWHADINDVKKIKIVDKDKMDRPDIKEFKDEIKDEYNIKISEVVHVDFEYEIKENGEWERHSDTAVLYKVSGKWFVLIGCVF